MRRRLLLLGLATVFTLLAFLGTIFGVIQARLITLRDREEQVAVATAVASDAAVLLPANLQNALGQTLEQKVSSRRAVFIIDRGGNVKAATRAAMGATESLQNRFDALSQSQQRWARRVALGLSAKTPGLPVLPLRPTFAVAPIRLGEQTIGAVIVTAEPDQLRSSVIRSWVMLLLGGLFLVALSALAAIPITRRIVQPLLTLGKAMDEVAAGAETARVDDRVGPPEVRVLARRFNLMADDVQTSFQRQRNFATDASHQLRNPLTALRLRVEDVGMQLDALDGLPPELAASQRKVLMSLERMDATVEDLLQNSRRNRNSPVIGESPGLVVADRIDEWRAIAGLRGIAIVVQPLGQEQVISQPGGVGQVLDVLIDNAVKFSPEGSTVWVHSIESELTIELVVRDQGPGFSDFERKHALQRSWRGDLWGASQGHGLGLAIANSVIENVGGALTLESDHEVGARAVACWVRTKHQANLKRTSKDAV